jgi:deoxyribonuclease-4
MFMASPRTWALPYDIGSKRVQKAIELFKKRCRILELGPVVVHARYLLNLTSDNESLREKSIKIMLEELALVEALGADFYVVHAGSAKDIRSAVRRLKEAFREGLQATTGVRLLVENTAGRDETLGGNLEAIGEVVRDEGRLGMCLDLAHAFESGYNLAENKGALGLMNKLDHHLGRGKVMAVHANDSLTALRSHHDRHQHVGEGEIGRQGFVNMMRIHALQPLPWILETPKSTPKSDWQNLERLRDIAEEALL